jgi:hypothetical protein
MSFDLHEPWPQVFPTWSDPHGQYLNSMSHGQNLRSTSDQAELIAQYFFLFDHCAAFYNNLWGGGGARNRAGIELPAQATRLAKSIPGLLKSLQIRALWGGNRWATNRKSKRKNTTICKTFYKCSTRGQHSQVERISKK